MEKLQNEAILVSSLVSLSDYLGRVSRQAREGSVLECETLKKKYIDDLLTFDKAPQQMNDNNMITNNNNNNNNNNKHSSTSPHRSKEDTFSSLTISDTSSTYCTNDNDIIFKEEITTNSAIVETDDDLELKRLKHKSTFNEIDFESQIETLPVMMERKSYTKFYSESHSSNSSSGENDSLESVSNEVLSNNSLSTSSSVEIEPVRPVPKNFLSFSQNIPKSSLSVSCKNLYFFLTLFFSEFIFFLK